MKTEKEYLKIAGNVHLAYYVEAADLLNIKYEIIIKGLIARFEHNGKPWFIINTVTPLTNTPGTTIAKRKYLTNLILSKAGIPVPAQAKIFTKEDALTFFRTHKDIVIKPAQALGGHGITILPETEEDVLAAYNFALEKSKSKEEPKVLGEEFIRGQHYRLLVLQDQVIGIVKRVPAKVTGNGKDSIKKLVETENYARKQAFLKSIPTDEQYLKKLQSQGFTTEYVPQAEEIIELRFHANLTAGGTTEECFDQVHPYYKELAVTAVKAIGMEFSGVDLIAGDISKPAKCAINEINYNPGLRPHYKVTKGNIVKVAVPIMKYIKDNG